MNPINYFYEDTSFLLEHKEAHTSWLIEAIHTEKHSLNSINYIFCSDKHLLEINQTYLNHDFYTDIITFDNSEEEGKIESDIFISVDRVKENARFNNSDYKTELKRVMIHGVLHLVGYNDKTPEEQSVMREKENAYLSLLLI